MDKSIRAVSSAMLLLLVLSIAAHPLQLELVLGQPPGTPTRILTEDFSIPADSVNSDNWNVTNPNAGIITVASGLLTIDTAGVAPPVCLQSKLTDILKPFRVEIRFKTDYDGNQTFFGLDTFRSAGSHRRTIGLFKNSTMTRLQFYNGSLVVLDYSFSVGIDHTVVLDYNFEYFQITIDGWTLPRLRIKYYDLDSLTLGSSKDDVSKVAIDYVYVDSYAPDPYAQDSVELWPGTHPGWDYNLSKPENIVKMGYPKSTILIDTTGDLLFKITIVNPRYGIRIYIPPEFGAFTVGNVWTSATNDYNAISTSTLGSSDLIAPSWRLVTIEPIDNPVNRMRIGIPIPALSSGSPNPFPYTFYVRVFEVKAPIIAGRYFFKIFMLHQSGSTVYTSIGSARFPTLVVKGEVDPAYISGTILYGGSYYYGYYFGQPIDLPGRVVATGVTPEGRVVRGMAYFNSTAKGRYTIYGLAPGTYNLTASAAGFPSVTLDRQITVLAGQSLDGVNIYIYPGAQVNGTVWSKDCGGLSKIPWGAAYTITITLYDLNWGLLSTVSGIVNASRDNYNFTFGASPYWLVNTDFTGHIPQDYADYVSGLEAGIYYLNATVSGYVQMHIFTAVVPSAQYTGAVHVEMDLWKCKAPYTPPAKPTYYGNLNVTIYSVNWQKPPQRIPWAYPGLFIRVHVYTIAGIHVKTYIFKVPSVGDSISFRITTLATGVYTVKAFTPGYIQLDFPEVAVTANSTSDISLNLVKGGVIYTTINFKTEDLLAPISLTNHTPIRIEVYDATGKFVGANIGYVPPGLNQVSWPAFNFTRIIGFNSYAGNPSSRNYGKWVNYYDTTDGVLLLDYGLPAGSYTIKAWVPGYLQPAVVTATIALSGEAWVVFDLHRMAHVYGRWPDSGVGWFNMFSEVYPLSWAEVKASGPVVAVTYSLDGNFDLWLPAGSYTITFDVPPYHVYSPEIVTISVTWASESELATNLKETAIPIPEFPIAHTLAITTALPILILCRCLKVVTRRRKTSQSFEKE